MPSYPMVPTTWTATRYGGGAGSTGARGDRKRKEESRNMEELVNLRIEKLPEGVYLATSEDVPGLVAQGRTVAETLEIARDVAGKLLEARAGAARPT